MLSVLNCSLLLQVILAIFVPYFYPGANFGVNFRGLDRRLWCKQKSVNYGLFNDIWTLFSEEKADLFTFLSPIL